jgi:hypothetical protein
MFLILTRPGANPIKLIVSLKVRKCVLKGDVFNKDYTWSEFAFV